MYDVPVRNPENLFKDESIKLLSLKSIHRIISSKVANYGGNAVPRGLFGIQHKHLLFGHDSKIYFALAHLLRMIVGVVYWLQDPHLRRKALQMFTRRLDHEGGALRLTPGEERLFVDMVPSLRSLAMGKKATGESWTAEEYSTKDGGLEEVRVEETCAFRVFVFQC